MNYLPITSWDREMAEWRCFMSEHLHKQEAVCADFYSQVTIPYMEERL